METERRQVALFQSFVNPGPRHRRIHGDPARRNETIVREMLTDGLTGSEIENVFVDALFKAFEAGKEPTDLTVAEVLMEFVPLSKLMAEQMTGLRNWVKGRARSATSLQEVEGGLRRIAA
jgi:hypothetical protein